MITAQILGIMAVITFLMSFQFKTRRNIIVVNLVSRLLYILQYIILGAFEGAILDFMGFVLSFFAKYKDSKIISKKLNFFVIISNIVLLIVSLFLYENIFSLFAMCGIIFEVTALWLTKEKNIRILSLCAAPFWFTYNFANRAYGSCLGNILTLLSISVAMARMDIDKNKN